VDKPTQSLTGEDGIVAFLRNQYGGKNVFVKQGIGDDAAVLSQRGAAEHWVVTTDMLLQDVDFRVGWLTPDQLGHKALAVNLSDLAAMGARPRFCTVALALPPTCSPAWIDHFYRGLTSLGKREGVVLVGGDLSRSPRGIDITITAVGETVGRNPIYRSRGKAGDALFVTGVLGQSAAGLELLQKKRRKGRSPAERQALKAHRMPQPRCRAGLWLAKRRLARCMIDLSDGLSTDLTRVCRASGLGAEICRKSLPLFTPASRWGCDPLELALHGGEDFELLFSVPAAAVTKLKRSYPPGFPKLTRIGRLKRGTGIMLTSDQDGAFDVLEPRGFDHFRDSARS
jgi:thiamine-monophosphate kinase